MEENLVTRTITIDSRSAETYWKNFNYRNFGFYAPKKATENMSFVVNEQNCYCCGRSVSIVYLFIIKQLERGGFLPEGFLPECCICRSVKLTYGVKIHV